MAAKPPISAYGSAASRLFSRTRALRTQLSPRNSLLVPPSTELRALRQFPCQSCRILRARKKAAAIIINGLGNKPLRVVVSHRRDPALLIFKLSERYASSTLATRMSLFQNCTSFHTFATRAWVSTWTQTLPCSTVLRP
jgi:hypothetical protein